MLRLGLGLGLADGLILEVGKGKERDEQRPLYLVIRSKESCQTLRVTDREDWGNGVGRASCLWLTSGKERDKMESLEKASRVHNVGMYVCLPGTSVLHGRSMKYG